MDQVKIGQFIKTTRKEKNLTQREVAESLSISEKTVSKWETDNALPAIDSLKLISELFHVSIDDLISDGDIETKRLRDEKRAKIMYFIAIGFLVLATGFSLLAYFLKQPYFAVGGTISVILYIVFGILSKPQYKRIPAKKLLLPYVISRAVILLFVIGLIVFTVFTL